MAGMVVAASWIGSPARAHATHEMVANDSLEAGLTSEEVHATRWVAQSFLTPTNVSDFAVSRVSLHLEDLGTDDVLALSVRADDGGAPAAANLTEGAVDGPATRDWVDVDVAPHATLTGGTTYWIVVHSLEAAGNGYAWYHSAVYGDGEAATSTDGAAWSALLVDLTFRVYGYETPDFAYAVTSSEATLEPGNATVLEVWFNNTGSTTAETLWVNVTYPAGLAYVTDDAADEGGVRTGTSYEFTDVAPGNHSFNITAEAEGGVEDGAEATVHFTFEAADHAGAPTTHDEREVSVTLHNAVLSYDAAANATTLRPPEEALLRFTLDNAGNGTAAHVWVNLTLPADIRYVDDDAAAAGGTRSGAYSFDFANRTPGTTVFNVTVAAEGGVADNTDAVVNVTFEAVDALGSPLNASASDLLFTLRNARLEAVLAASAPTADPGDRVTFVGNVSNAGGAGATNLTLLGSVDPNATYVASSPAGTWDPDNRTVRWSLATLAAGGSTEVEWTVEVLAGTADNATLTAWLRTEYEDPSGTPMPAVNVSEAAAVQAPVFDPALHVDPAEAQRYDEVAAYLYYNNTGSGTAARAWVNWTLGAHYTLLGLVPDSPYVLTQDGFAVNLTEVAPGDHLLVARLRVLPAGPDGLPMDVAMNWTATDANGHLLPQHNRTATVVLRAPAFSPDLRINRTAVQRGDLLEATVTYNNTGSVAAQWVWLNWTFGGHYALVSLAEDLPFLATGDGVAVLHTEVTPGPHRLTLTLRVVRGADDGLALPLELRWAARDGNGHPLPETSLRATAELHAPRITVSARGPQDPVPTGADFVLEATLANGGRASATGTMALNLPAGVAYVDGSGPLEGAAEEGRVLWTVPSLDPGEAVQLHVRLRADAPGEQASFRWTFAGADGSGGLLETASSDPVEVAFLPPPPFLGLGTTGVAALGVLAAGLLTAVILLRRRTGPPAIEEVFVVDAGGTLLAHRSHSLLAERDEDILAAMLSAVQEFIRDAFSRGTQERLRSLNFGERTILVEPGTHHYVAVVCRHPDERLEARLRRLSEEVETRFGPVLEDWDGDMRTVRGVQNVLPLLWGGEETEEG